MSYIQIEDAASNTVQFTPANYGYATEVNLALHINEREDGSFGTFDDGSQYDYRVCRATWELSNSDAENFHSIFRDRSKSRGKSVNLILPSGSGFFLYGADKGDTGTFLSRVISFNQIGTKNSPYRFFGVDVTFIAESFPAYTPPAQSVIEGGIQIGSVTGLRFPLQFAELENSYAYDSVLTRDGSPYTTDKTSNADQYVTNLQMVANQPNAAALLSYIIGTSRGDPFTISATQNGFIFGRDKDSNALTSYSCKLVDPKISIVSPHFNRFDFNLRVYLESAS